ncbi:MAG: OmpA family protein [Confluentibacter sp.]|nr:OmpA family protein [Confluentibacter sp.]
MKYPLILCILLCANLSSAQLLKKLTKKAEQAAERTLERKVEEKTEEKTSQVVDSIFEAPKKVTQKSSKEKKTNNPSNSEQEIEIQNNETQTAIISGSTFFPNGSIVFFESFENDSTGDFPANWETNSGGEIILIDNEKAFRLYPNGIYIPNLDRLPENYALEFDLITSNLKYKGLSGSNFSVEIVNEKTLSKNTSSGAKFEFSLWKGSSLTSKIHVENWGKNIQPIQNNIDFKLDDILNAKTHFTLLINNKRFRLYVNNEKAVDLPTFIQTQNNYIRFNLKGTDKNLNHIAAIQNVKITQESEDLRSLILKGGFSTTEILFNSGSDQIKQESFPFLEKLGTTLKQDSSLRLLIIGHTDSDGDQVKNMTLSKSRAFAVANYLIDVMGIDKKRLTTQGRGENEPVADNTSESGKAKNRRVEFKKI